MIKIVDYGLGNISAFINVYKQFNMPAEAAKSATELEGASRIILPGVGAFDSAMGLLQASGMRPKLEELVLHRKVPVLGVCVGMQMLAESSDEGRLPGLGWVPGRVRGFWSDPRSAQLPLPHMGWNDVRPNAKSNLFEGLEGDVRFYFLHSFYFECSTGADTTATAHYGLDFSCAVRADNVHGVQFHPEKSHHYGAALLNNFARA